MSNDETAVSPSIVSAKKRNSSGDTANTTLNGIPSPSSLVPGTRLEARDGQGSDKWFSVKVQEVDVEESEVLVHYHNWNSRHDEWISIDSSRLRVPHRTSNRHDSGSMISSPCDEGKDPASAAGGEFPGALGMKGPAMKEFKSGEKVMAVWKLNRKYPAKIVRFEPDGTYLVEFCEDGVECKVKPNNIRRMRKEEEEQFGIEMSSNGIDSHPHENSADVGEEVESARSSRRRERKMKFDLKSVLNIRTTPPSTPPPPQVVSEKANKGTKVKPESKQNNKKNSDTSNNSIKGASKASSSDPDAGVNNQKESENRSTIKKDTDMKPPRKKQPNQYTKRREELERKQNMMKDADSSNNTTEKDSSDNDNAKRNKSKKNSSKSLAPVTNGKDSMEKKSSNKSFSNNNSSKSTVASSTDKVKENVSNTESYNSKSVEIVQTVTGKRKRKPKKFWDEAEEQSLASLPSSKQAKKKTSEDIKKDNKAQTIENSNITNKSKNRRSSESLSVSQSTVKSKNVDVQIKDTDVLEKTKVKKLNNLSDASKVNANKATKKDEPSSKRSIQNETVSNVNTISVPDKFKKSENGKVLLYKTSFDMTDDPSKIAAKMKEGVNIPGPGVSIPVDSSRLPKGWEKRVIQRGIGVTKGKWDVFIVEEEGRKSFRSKTDLQRHIDEKKLPYTSDAFDFSLDDNLKKLRQIWKQYIVKPRLKPGEKMSPLVPAKKGKKKSEGFSHLTSLHSPQLSSLSELHLTTHPLLPNMPISQLNSPTSSMDYQESEKALSSEFSMDVDNADKNLSEEMMEQNRVLQRQEREAELIASKLGVVSETGQGLRCSVKTCGKLFRREKLLRQHVKHYHPKEYKDIINSSKIQCDHEGEMRPPNFDKKRKLSQGIQDLNNENKRLKRNSLGLNSQLSGDEDDLEIDSPSPLSHMNSLTANAVRKRNDSVLSASSGFSDGDNWNDRLTSPLDSHSSVTLNSNNYPKSKGRLIPPSPSTPPTFRFSRRRQAQLRVNRRNDQRTSPRETLDSGSAKTTSKSNESVTGNCMSPKVALTILDDSMLASPALRLSEQQLSPAAGCSQTNSAAVNMNVTGQSSYPPSEMDVLSVTGSEHLTSDELVNCSCRRLEEDGLMIQCDICLCWQHGSCLAIEEEDQVPEYYICETCRNPRLGRSSAKYSIDQDWLNKGTLPNVMPSRISHGEAGLKADTNVQSSFLNNSKQPLHEKDAAFRKLSELMADLASLSKLLHSLRVKLHIASQSNNSKVFMWSSLWDPPSKLIASPPKTEEISPLTNSHLFNTDEMATIGQPTVDQSQSDLITNVNLIPSTMSHNLMTENICDHPLSQNNQEKLVASSNVFKVDNGQLDTSHDIHIDKNYSSQDLLPSMKIDTPKTNANTSQNGPNNIGSSTFPCPTQINTPLSQPQAELRSTNDIQPPNNSSASNQSSEEKLSNGSMFNDSSNQSYLDTSNAIEKSTNCLEVTNSQSCNIKEDSRFVRSKIEEESDFKIPLTLGRLVNGHLSKKLTENDACEESRKSIQANTAELNKANGLIFNGSVSENFKDEKIVFDPKDSSSQLAISNNKENEPDVASPIINGENHIMAEKNINHASSGDHIKNITQEMDIKSVDHSTNSQILETPVSKPSEPQMNGLLEVSSSESSPSATNDTDKNGLLLTSKEQHNGEIENRSTEDISSTSECATTDKSLQENSFSDSQHDVLLDENQEVDPSMIPSLSEVQQLLPSLMSSLEEQLFNDQQQVQMDTTLEVSASAINSLSSDVNNIASLDVANQPLQQFQTPLIPPTPVFPETKRIDKDECRLNLMHHIDAVQTEFENRLNLVEATLAEIDSSKTSTNSAPTSNDTDDDSDPAAKTKAILTLLLHDLRTSKNLVSLS